MLQNHLLPFLFSFHCWNKNLWLCLGFEVLRVSFWTKLPVWYLKWSRKRTRLSRCVQKFFWVWDQRLSCDNLETTWNRFWVIWAPLTKIIQIFNNINIYETIMSIVYNNANVISILRNNIVWWLHASSWSPSIVFSVFDYHSMQKFILIFGRLSKYFLKTFRIFTIYEF